MSRIDRAPYIKILMKIKAVLLTVDWHDRAGIAPTHTFTVRHTRNRSPVTSERPCLSLLFVSDEAQQTDQDRNDWETVRELEVDLIADLRLATEISGDDPTALDDLSAVLATAVEALKDPDDNIYLDGMVDMITYGVVDPDEKSNSDDGRLVRGITVLYRVRSDDPNVLLSTGED